MIKNIYDRLFEYFLLNGKKLIIIENIFDWFFNQPNSIKLSFGLLVICIIMISYNPLTFIMPILIGLIIAAIIRIFLYYIINL